MENGPQILFQIFYPPKNGKLPTKNLNPDPQKYFYYPQIRPKIPTTKKGSNPHKKGNLPTTKLTLPLNLLTTKILNML